MCGIAGEYRFDGEPVWPERTRAMVAALVHRGPDDAGEYVGPSCGLAMRRLSVIAREGGAQPAQAAAGMVQVVFNGEIYNHRELRRQLVEAGERFEAAGDAEVIARLYAREGLDFVRRLRGMFAIAIFDVRSRTLVLARDHLGQKPLFFYHRAGRFLAFASELGSLLRHPGVPRRHDHHAIDQYLSYRITRAPRTCYRDICKLEPGTILVARRDGHVETSRYWSSNYKAAGNPLKRADAKAQLRALLMNAVESQLESEVPLGATLSGGLDSSLVVALMRRLGVRDVPTFTVGFSSHRFDERPHAKEVAGALGTHHRDYEIQASDVEEAVTALVPSFGQPFAFPSVLASYYMYKLAKQHATVVLGGDGSDELFCGYERYRVFAALLAGRDIPERTHLRVDRELLRRANGDPALLYQALLADGLSEPLKARLYASSFQRALRTTEPDLAEVRELFEHTSATGPVERAMELDSRFWLPDAQLAKVDIGSMRSAVEVREPFLDHELFDAAAGLALSLKMSRDQNKAILRDVALEFLGESVVYRPKQELAVPLEAWIGDALRREIISVVTSESALARGYFDPDALLAWVRDSGTRDPYALWTLYMLERWHRWDDSLPAVAQSAGLTSSVP